MCITTQLTLQHILGLALKQSAQLAMPDIQKFGIGMEVLPQESTFQDIIRRRSSPSSGSNTCSITADYRLVCWGANDMGQLGQGSTSQISRMVNVTLSSLEEPVDVAVGEHHLALSPARKD